MVLERSDNNFHKLSEKFILICLVIFLPIKGSHAIFNEFDLFPLSVSDNLPLPNMVIIQLSFDKLITHFFSFDLCKLFCDITLI